MIKAQENDEEEEEEEEEAEVKGVVIKPRTIFDAIKYFKITYTYEK